MNTLDKIEIKLPRVSQAQLGSLTDFLAELLVAERLQELDQIEQYRRHSSIERQQPAGGRKWN